MGAVIGFSPFLPGRKVCPDDRSQSHVDVMGAAGEQESEESIVV
jgi:hypothetical protein